MGPECPVCKSRIEFDIAIKAYVCQLCNLVAIELLLIEVTKIKSLSIPPEVNEIFAGSQQLVEIYDYSDPEQVKIRIPVKLFSKLSCHSRYHGIGSYIDKLREEGCEEIIITNGDFRVIKKVITYRNTFDAGMVN